MKLTRFLLFAAALVISAVAASADSVYVDDSQGNLYVGDPTTGAFSLVGNSAAASAFGGLTDIDFASNGTLYGLDPSGNLYTVSTVDGSIAPVGATGISDYLAGMAGDNAGNLYAGGTGQIFQINPSNAAASGSIGGGAGGYVVSGDLEFIGSALYATSVTGSTVNGGEFWSIDPSTGVGTDIGNTGFSNVFGMAYDTNNSTLYGYTNIGTEFTIDPTTGIGTLAYAQITGTNIGIDGDQLFGAAYESSAPEPSTFGLILAGAAMSLYVVNRRRKAINRA